LDEEDNEAGDVCRATVIAKLPKLG
jgi:hypothetical protein